MSSGSQISIETPAAAPVARPDAADAVLWSGANQLASAALRFGLGVALARLLSPDDFGVMGMTAVLTGFAAVFSDVGFGAALIQREQLEERHLCSVFWLNVALGCGLTALVALASPLVAAFFGHAVLAPLTAVASCTFAIGSVTIVHAALLTRKLRFRALARIDVTALAGGGAAGVAAALAGAGVWSLVWFALVRSATRGLLLVGTVRWRPKSGFERASIRELSRFSSNVLGFNSVNYWIRNADNLLVGRFLDAAALGIYTRAYQLLLLPLAMVTRPLSRVMFPAFSRIQDDRRKVGSVYLRVAGAVALVTFPMMVGLIVTAREFVLGLFGEPWLPMVPVLQIFAVAGMIDSIGALNGTLYLSQGRSDLQFRVAAILGAISIPLQAVGLFWGVVGVTAAYSIYATLAFVPAVAIATRLVGLGVADVLRAVSGPLACSVGMGAALVLLGSLVPDGMHPLALLGVRVGAGVAVYGILVNAFGLAAQADVRQVLRQRLRRPA